MTGNIEEVAWIVGGLYVVVTVAEMILHAAVKVIASIGERRIRRDLMGMDKYRARKKK